MSAVSGSFCPLFLLTQLPVQMWCGRVGAPTGPGPPKIIRWARLGLPMDSAAQPHTVSLCLTLSTVASRL